MRDRALGILYPTLTANQIEFVDLIIDHLAERGIVEPAQLYELPFTGVSSRGPEELSPPAELDALLRDLDAVRASAVAA